MQSKRSAPDLQVVTRILMRVTRERCERPQPEVSENQTVAGRRASRRPVFTCEAMRVTTIGRGLVGRSRSDSKRESDQPR